MTFPSVQFTNTEIQIQIQIQIQFVLARRTTSSIKLNLLKSDQVKRPLLEEELGKALVKAPCRRHIRDLFGKKSAKGRSGTCHIWSWAPPLLEVCQRMGKYSSKYWLCKPGHNRLGRISRDLHCWFGGRVENLVSECNQQWHIWKRIISRPVVLHCRLHWGPNTPGL